MLRPFALASSLIALAASAVATPDLVHVPFSGYSYNIAPSGLYPDSTGSELTDGITFSLAWGSSFNPTFEDVNGLVGWQSATPTLTFTFAAPVTITSVSTYFADSDTAAGVSLPATVTLGDGDAFSQTFNVDNPSGNGSTIESIFDGFSITTDTLTLTYTLGVAQQWTMLAEVQAFAAASVPEPAASTLLLAASALALAASRRRRT